MAKRMIWGLVAIVALWVMLMMLSTPTPEKGESSPFDRFLPAQTD